MPKKSSKYYVVKLGKGYWYGPIDDYTSLERSKKFDAGYYSKEYVEDLMNKKIGDIPHVIWLMKVTHEIIYE
ncbi:hypothetical protein NGB30_01705 [Mammaliicoccus fleurettii]|uniref:hypothetical protein n=1 Tax=Mammaliicoccus fleurettii TaxID=150056 RepID=UPI002DBCD8ED|nr:hypothetical protein [Mammaliicoccus fleurettii]MEB7779247.1 hypothetical protein [Mammaliicoccus fleurettii]